LFSFVDRIGFTLWVDNMKHWEIEHREDIIEFNKKNQDNPIIDSNGCC